MKNILKYLLLPLLFVSILSCDNEDQTQLVVVPSGSGEITAPAPGSKYILNPLEVSTNPSFTLTWNAADYDVPTEITYTIEFAATGTSFAEPFVAGTTTNLNYSWNVSEFNGAAVTAGLPPFIEGSLDIRIISKVGNFGVEEQISEALSILVTPFTTDLPTIAVPGEHQGWDPATAPRLASSGFGETDYEGYVWLTNDADEGFKFIAPDQTGGFFWENTDWGDDGTKTGKLVAEDESNCQVDEPGYYLVKADTDALTYSTEIMNWSITGDATPKGWPPSDSDGVPDNDHDMIYDSESRTLSIDIKLTANSIKFRANDAWSINLGDNDADGTLEFGGTDISIPESGDYTVTLDLSNPREYTYSLVKN